MKHANAHPQAGQTVKLKLKGKGPGIADGDLYRVEDYWDRVVGKSWMNSDGNPAALNYAMRSAFSDLPTDDEVLYGKVDGLGHLIHVSEIEVAS